MRKDSLLIKQNSNIITTMEQEQKTMQEKSDWLSGRHTRDTAKLARQYHESGFTLEDPSEDILAGLGQCNSPAQANEVWYGSGKHERYGIAAELIDRTISTAENHIYERPPFGLLKIIPSNSKVKDSEYQVVEQFVRHVDPFDQVKGYFTNTLLHAQAEAMGQLEMASDKTLYDRHLDWVKFANKNGMGELDSRRTLSNPITHATDVMTDVLRVVPWVYKKERPNQDPSSSDLTNIASNSYSIVAYLASFELYSFKYAKLLLNGPLMDRSLSAEYLDLIEDGKGNIRLAFEDQIKHKLDKIRSDTNLMQGPRIGCPAMIDFGERSAMQRLWRWHVAVGEALYQNSSSRLT